MAYTNEQLGKALEDLTIAYNNFIKKAKDAAISAMSETVIKQIKQDAKTYIAEELTAQKNELMQAIEHAKIALRNSAIEAGSKLEQTANETKNELQALITTAEDALKEKAKKIEAETLQNINATKEKTKKELNDLALQLIKNVGADIRIPLNPAVCYDFSHCVVNYMQRTQTVFKIKDHPLAGEGDLDIKECKGQSAIIKIRFARVNQEYYPVFEIILNNKDELWSSKDIFKEVSSIDFLMAFPDKVDSLIFKIKPIGRQPSFTTARISIDIMIPPKNLLLDSSAYRRHSYVYNEAGIANDDKVGTFIGSTGIPIKIGQHNDIRKFIGTGKRWTHSRWVRFHIPSKDLLYLWTYGGFDYMEVALAEKLLNFGCYKNASNNLIIPISMADICPIEDYTLQWYHIVVMTDMQEKSIHKTIFIDGKKVAEKSVTGDFTEFLQGDFVYKNVYGDSLNYGTAFAHYLFFSRLLTEGEIQWLYRNPYYSAKQYSLAEYKADENRKLIDELKKKNP